MPKIILEDIPPRISVREPQLAEQLLEVPTILYFLKQTVDIPVPRGRARRFQGFLPTQSFTAFSAGLQQGQQRLRHPQFPALQLMCSTLRMRRLKGFFRTFPRVAGQMSAELGGHVSSSTLGAHQMVRAGDALQDSGCLQGDLPGPSSTRGVGLSDGAARWQAQDPGSEFWLKCACRYFLQGGTGPSVHLCALCAWVASRRSLRT